MNNISIIILTYNEEKHIERCVKSLQSISSNIFIVDSFSTDKTIEIAMSLGAKVLQNKWINYAKQFQWALDNCPIQTTWVMRMDADEYVLPDLAKEIQDNIDNIDESISGLYIKRRMYFKGRWIKYGAKYPEWLLRIWRFKDGYIEEKWMDEHVVLTKGGTQNLKNDLVDDNLNGITWWTNKHNNYATREAIDILNINFNFNKSQNEISPNLFGNQVERKKYLKNIYANLPLFTRPFIYFFWRYILRFGFLDRTQGLIWHFLQAFWYRFLVDVKIYEIKNESKRLNISIPEFIKKEYNIEI